MKLLAKHWQRNTDNGREFDEVEWYLRKDGSVLMISIDHYQVAHVTYWNGIETLGDDFLRTVLSTAEEIDEINVSFLKWLYSDCHEGEYEDLFYDFIKRYDLLSELVGVYQGMEEEVREELLRMD